MRTLGNDSRLAVQRFGNRSEIEVVVAPGRHGRADENAIDEEGLRHLLQPQPWVPDRARDDVEHYRRRKAEQHDAAQDHQYQLETIQRAPFQVALPLQYQFVRDRHGSPQQVNARSATSEGRAATLSCGPVG